MAVQQRCAVWMLQLAVCVITLSASESLLCIVCVCVLCCTDQIVWIMYLLTMHSPDNIASTIAMHMQLVLIRFFFSVPFFQLFWPLIVMMMMLVFSEDHTSVPVLAGGQLLAM